MKKYILLTSLVWFALIAAGAGLYFYYSRPAKRQASPSITVQPAAVGTASPATSSVPAAAQQPPLTPIQLTPERMQSIGVQTGTVEWKQIHNEIRATGTVDIDERLISYVQVRFSGYIRQVFVNATYQYVHKGDPLFTIYSPELVATQNEYLIALRNQKLLGGSTVDGVASGAEALRAAAEARLRQWDMPEAQIASVRKTGTPISDLVINSPVSGYIIERSALPNLYIQPATRLYSVADLSRIWVYAQVFQDDVSSLKPGDQARIMVDAYPNRIFSGRIESILPQVDVATRTVRVRLEIANPNLKLKPGMFVNVDLKTNLGRQLVAPASAILRSGTRELAFLYQDDGRIEPREIVTGARSGDDLVIVKGLTAHQRIVTSANFLIDSESQLQAAAGSFTPPPPGVSAATPQPAAATQAKIDFSSDPNPPRKGNNIFRVKVTGPDGKPLTGAAVSLTFFMPAMPGMGMAAMSVKPQLMDQGAGLYQGSGALPSGGTWQVSIFVQKGGNTVGAKQIRVNATGGM
ncbi:MAG TPA: efflux RND transporter periplasmic adaptor subunit [Bryobacteraceae bacterium]|nr:efflux RND transporter periplasmic adaptor subunit [Bryobacteraceae bacterium]